MMSHLEFLGQDTIVDISWPAEILWRARALAGSASTTGALLVTSGPGQCLSVDLIYAIRLYSLSGYLQWPT